MQQPENSLKAQQVAQCAVVFLDFVASPSHQQNKKDANINDNSCSLTHNIKSPKGCQQVAGASASYT